MLVHNSLGKSKQTNKNPNLELGFGVLGNWTIEKFE